MTDLPTPPAHILTYAWRVCLVLLVSGSGNDRTEELVLRVEAGHAGRPKGRKVTSLIVFPEPTLLCRSLSSS
jgi:hypothetical protein